MSFLKRGIPLICIFCGILCAGNGYAQIFNNGCQLTVSTNGTLFTQGDLINKDSSLYNHGKVIVKGNCVIQNKSTSRIITFNGDSLIVYGDFRDSSLYGQNSGVLLLKGSTQNISSTSHILANLAVAGGGNKNLLSTAYVRFNLNLQSGYIIVPTTVNFGMDSTGTLSPSPITTNSFVVGTFTRKRKTGTEDSLFFPIGNSSTQYRPATLLGIATVTGKYPVYTMGTAVASPKPGLEISSIFNRVWGLASTDTTVAISNIKLYYQPADVASTPAASLVVAQSKLINGTYNSIGEKTGSSSYVVSEFKPSTLYYTLGASNKIYGNFKVFLEGPYRTGPGMATNLSVANLLQDSVSLRYPMLGGYTAQGNFVDRIYFILQDPTTKNYVDTAYAWVISDGHIRDYATGTKTYVTFAKALANTNYNIIVGHRNHLPASSTPVMLSTTTFAAGSSAYSYDFSKGVYGGGAKYDAVNNNWVLYASDPYKSAKNQTDVVDLTAVGLDNNSALYRQASKYYYHDTDLNLDGVVNSSDYQIANDHNGKLYYSTLP
jgi:hypothetical protein